MADDRQCGVGNCALTELLPELLEFLSQDLEREQLTSVGRERQRSLLRQVSLLRIAQCGLPTQAAEMRRSQPPPVPPHGNHQQQQQQSSVGIGGFLSDALFPRRSHLTSSGRNHDPKNRMSLPPQVFSNLGFQFDKHETVDDTVYETPISKDCEDPLLLPGRRVVGPATAAAAAPSISGTLRYRHEDTCRWQRYATCLLMPAGCRLICFKTSRTSSSPALTLLLAGYVAIYVEQESSASHVIKLAHIRLPTHALSADTELEAREWISKINSCQQQQQHPIYAQVPLAGFDQEPDSGISGPVSSSSTDSYEQQQPLPPPPPPQQQKQRLTKSASFTPGFGQQQQQHSVDHHPADVPGAAHIRQQSASSASSGGGFMRRFRDSFGAGGSHRRRHRRAAAAEAAAAAAMAASAAAAAEAEDNLAADCLVEGDAEVRLGGRGSWQPCRARLRRGGRLCLPGVTPTPVQLDDRIRLLPLGDETAADGANRESAVIESLVAGQVVRRRKHQQRSSGAGRLCGVRLVQEPTPGSSVAAVPSVLVEIRGLDKLALGEWIKHLALATGLAPHYEPLAAELLDLSSARALDSRRRASMPERQLNRLADVVARAPRPLPPLPDTSTVSLHDAGVTPAGTTVPFCLQYDLSHADSDDADENQGQLVWKRGGCGGGGSLD